MKKWTFGLLALAVVAVFFGVSCDGGGGAGLVKKDCVVMLGDSIFAMDGFEAARLEKLSGHSYRKYYIVGAEMEGGMVTPVPQQYEKAQRADSNIRTVIFDGGGNDVLIGGNTFCQASYPNGTISARCKQMIEDVEEINKAFWQGMINDGVENIINQGYYLSTDRRFWQAGNYFQKRTIEEFNKVAQANPSVKMIYVDPRVDPYFDGSNAAKITKWDGIHPTQETANRLGDMVWNAMVGNGIEQTDSCAGGSGPVGPTPTPVGEIVSFVTAGNLALDVWEWGTVNGTNIAAWDYWAGDAQKFILTQVSGGYTLTPVIAQGMKVDIVDGSTAPGANVQIWESNGFDCQKFTLQNTNGGFQIKNVGSGLCLTAIAGNIIQDTCVSGNSNQVFQKK